MLRVQFIMQIGLSWNRKLSEGSLRGIWRNLVNQRKSMGYYDSIYGKELPHRAITVYMYLKERADRNLP